MKTQFTLFLLLTSSIAWCQVVEKQRIDNLKKVVIQLEEEIDIKTDSLINIRKEILRLEDEIKFKEHQTSDDELYLIVKLQTNGKVRKSNNPSSEIISKLNKNDTLKLIDYNEGYFLIKNGLISGYLSELYIKNTKEIEVFKKNLTIRKELKIKEAAKQKKIEYEKQQTLKLQKENEEAEAKKKEYERKLAVKKKKDEEYRSLILTKYGSAIGEKLLKGYYWIGMTDEMAIVSLGKPQSINKTVGVWGVHEQWIYQSKYLYFENGVLSSYQNQE